MTAKPMYGDRMRDGYYESVTQEPLDDIRRSECDLVYDTIQARRFRTLWNEIIRLRAEVDALRRDEHIQKESNSCHALLFTDY